MAPVLWERCVVEIHLLVTFVKVLGHIMKWTVRRIGGDVGEEALTARHAFRHPAHGPVEVDVRAIALERFQAAVVEENRVGVLAFAAGRIGRLADPAAAVHERFGETLVHRTHRVVVAEMPFAEDARRVAGVAEYLGQRRFLWLHHRPSDVCIDGSRAVVVPAGHQARARRSADGMNIEVRHRAAAFCHRVDVRGHDDGIAGGAEVTVALIVGYDDDNVRSVLADRQRRHTPDGNCGCPEANALEKAAP